MTLPTRDELAEILCEAFEQSHDTFMQRVYKERAYTPWANQCQEDRDNWLAAAEAILARLRPGWAEMEHDKDNYAYNLDQFRKERDALRADLLACAEALNELIGITTALHAKGFTATFNDFELLGRVIDRAKDASARPGVQAVLT